MSILQDLQKNASRALALSAALLLFGCLPDKPATETESGMDSVSNARIEAEALRALNFVRLARDDLMMNEQWRLSALEPGPFHSLNLEQSRDEDKWVYKAAYCRDGFPYPDRDAAPVRETLLVWAHIDGQVDPEDPLERQRIALVARKVASYLGPGSAGLYQFEDHLIVLSRADAKGQTTYPLTDEGCSRLVIPEGAPVFIQVMMRESKGSTESANTTYEVKACPPGQVGMRVTKQYVHKKDGEEKPEDMKVGPEETYTSFCTPVIAVTPVTPPVITPVVPPVVNVTPPVIVPPPAPAPTPTVTEGPCVGPGPCGSTVTSPPAPPAPTPTVTEGTCVSPGPCGPTVSPPAPSTGGVWYLGWQIVTNNSGMQGRWTARNQKVTFPPGKAPFCKHSAPASCTYQGKDWCGKYSHGALANAFIGPEVDQIRCYATATPH